MNLETQNFYGITTFGIRHISTACIGSYKSTPLIAFILASNAVILSWLISLDDFVLWDSLENVSTTVGADVGVVDYIQMLNYIGDRDFIHLPFLRVELLFEFEQRWQVDWKGLHQRHF